MEAPLYNAKNEPVGTIDIPKSLFGVSWNEQLVKQVLLAQLANRRRPWAHAKDRSEVRGGGKKPWRQKGTGRARHGSTRSPIWVGGGKAHGPISDRDYSQKVNKKMRQRALFSVLSKKLADGEVTFFDSLEVSSKKTKDAFALFSHILQLAKRVKKIDVAMLLSAENKTTTQAARNLIKIEAMRAQSLNLYDLLNHKRLFVERAAVSDLASHYRMTAGGAEASTAASSETSPKPKRASSSTRKSTKAATA